MKSPIGILKTFRIGNLLIIALLEFILHRSIISSALYKSGISPALSEANLGILIVFSMFLTWSGYLINDIYDYDIDRINKSGFSQVDYFGGKNGSWKAYVILSLFCLLLAIYLSVTLGKWNYFWLLPLAMLTLWLYSSKLKNHFFLGNIGVSVLVCLVILLVWLSENTQIGLISDISVKVRLSGIFLLYAAFAFLTTWARELVKDAQDLEGDRHNNLQTFPARYGTKPTMHYLIILLSGLLTMMCLVFYINIGIFSNFQILFAIFFLILPVLLVMGLAVKAWRKSDFGRMSFLLKLTMLAGIIFLLTLL